MGREKSKKKKIYLTEIISVLVVGVFALCCVAPFIYVFFVSFMPYSEYLENPMKVIPSEFDLTAYRQLLDYDLIQSGYLVTISITVIGTALSVLLLVITAYPLSKKRLRGHKVFMGMVLFTMFFNGGTITNYLLVRNIGIYNTIWALILPGCLSGFNLILMKNFIVTSVPEALEEAARIDGANDLKTLLLIVVPMLKPAIATMVVFCSVGYWNNYFSAMMYVSDRDLWPLTLVLRELVVEDTSSVSPVTEMLTSANRSHTFTLKMAAIIITVIPILIVYPFMQRYFVKGVSLGSVKE